MTQPAYRSQIDIKYHLENLQPETEDMVKQDVEYFLTQRLDGYLTRELKNPDTVMIIHVRIKKMLTNEHDTDGQYTWSVEFDIRNGRKPIIYHTKQPFTNLKDVVSHAFARCKEELADA